MGFVCKVNMTFEELDEPAKIAEGAEIGQMVREMLALPGAEGIAGFSIHREIVILSPICLLSVSLIQSFFKKFQTPRSGPRVTPAARCALPAGRACSVPTQTTAILRCLTGNSTSCLAMSWRTRRASGLLRPTSACWAAAVESGPNT